ncbi:ATP-binding protein [Rhizobium sp. S152]|uniref:ATP-binding protein n=1 Tax=Rhizobium sp. S152 TaxID=3055038 RepID=UPI0025A96182|nr:ATP-binding protein [Rhizobium sp. S152]MDM9627854.1 ATP-binding protein [Rhizobium sp. S152]
MSDNSSFDPIASAAAHLVSAMDPEARARAEAIGRLNQAYIESDQHTRVLAGVNDLIENAASALNGEAGKRRALFVLGASGSGKTTALQHTLLNRPELQPYYNSYGNEVRHLIHMEAPKPASMKLFGRKMVEATGYPLSNSARYTENELFELAKRQLRERQVLFLYVDEMQHLLRANKAEDIVNVADTLKSLLQIENWPLHLIVAGMPVLAKFLEEETQLRNRSLLISLEQTTFPQDKERVRKIAQGIIESHAKLRLDGSFFTDTFLEKLVKSADGGFGTIIQMVRGACQIALQAKLSEVGNQQFAECYARITGCQPAHNMFLSADWRKLTPATTLADLAAKQARADRVAKATKTVREG